MKIESKIGKIPNSSETIFTFISNFNNFENFVPTDKVSDFESTGESCSFSVPGMGTAGLKIIEKEPNKLIKISNDEKTSINFYLWIQLKEVAEQDTRIKITMKPDVNPMMLAMIKNPLKKFVDSLVEKMESFPFGSP